MPLMDPLAGPLPRRVCRWQPRQGQQGPKGAGGTCLPPPKHQLRTQGQGTESLRTPAEQRTQEQGPESMRAPVAQRTQGQGAETMRALALQSKAQSSEEGVDNTGAMEATRTQRPPAAQGQAAAASGAPWTIARQPGGGGVNKILTPRSPLRTPSSHLR